MKIKHTLIGGGGDGESCLRGEGESEDSARIVDSSAAVSFMSYRVAPTGDDVNELLCCDADVLGIGMSAGSLVGTGDGCGVRITGKESLSLPPTHEDFCIRYFD